MIHGKADDIIPFAHGEKLFNAAISPKLYLWVEEANHNDLFWVAEEKYHKTLQEFTKLVKANQQLSRHTILPVATFIDFIRIGLTPTLRIFGALLFETLRVGGSIN